MQLIQLCLQSEGLMSAVAWPVAILSVASVLDNPWSVCVHRSAEVGRHLAGLLMTREQGRRPVTLIGYSLGARVIYYCLLEMAANQNCHGHLTYLFSLFSKCIFSSYNYNCHNLSRSDRGRSDAWCSSGRIDS